MNLRQGAVNQKVTGKSDFSAKHFEWLIQTERLSQMDEFVNEAWKAVENFPTYEISSCGNFRHALTGFIRKQSLDGRGYLFVTVRRGGRYFALRMHRLVAKAFLGVPTKEQVQVNHIDGVKTNNHVSNLEWATASENIRHAYKTGLNRGLSIRKTTTGAKSGFKGVTFINGKWRTTIWVNKKSVYVGTFSTPEEAHEAYQIAEQHYFPEGNQS